MGMEDAPLSAIVEMICRVGGIPGLAPNQDFYDAGVSSVNALPLLLEIEDRFQVTVPDDRFIAARTAESIHALIHDLRRA